MGMAKNKWTRCIALLLLLIQGMVLSAAPLPENAWLQCRQKLVEMADTNSSQWQQLLKRTAESKKKEGWRFSVEAGKEVQEAMALTRETLLDPDQASADKNYETVIHYRKEYQREVGQKKDGTALSASCVLVDYRDLSQDSDPDPAELRSITLVWVKPC